MILLEKVLSIIALADLAIENLNQDISIFFITNNFKFSQLIEDDE